MAPGDIPALARLSACRASADLLGQPDENALGASDVAEPIHVFVLDHFVDELRAVSVEPGERIVEVVHGEHDTQVAQSVHRGVPVIGNHRRREKSREFDPHVARLLDVRTEHGGTLVLTLDKTDFHTDEAKNERQAAVHIALFYAWLVLTGHSTASEEAKDAFERRTETPTELFATYCG